MEKNILIINAHWNNRGDESALRAMIDSLHEIYPKAVFYVQLFTNSVQQFPEEPYIKNLQFVYPRKRAIFELPLVVLTKGKCALLSSTKDYIKLIKKMDLIIHAPGGPSIGDIYMHAELLYLMKFIIAKAVGIPYVFYAPSMGPFCNKKRNRMRKYVLNRAEMISVREAVSEKYLEDLGVKKKINVTLDAAIQKKISEKKYLRLLQDYSELNRFIGRYKKIIGVTITELEWQPYYKTREDIKEQIYESFHALLKKLKTEQYGVIFIPQLFGEQNDKKLMESYAKSFDNTFVMDDKHDCYFQQYVIGKLYAIVGMRYHSNIFSVKMGTPFLSISYEQKMRGFVQKIGMEELCLQVDDLNEEILCKKFEYLMEHYMDYKNKIKKIIPNLVKESHKTTELVVDVLEK